MRTLWCIQHEDDVPPGAVSTWCTDHDFNCTIVRPDRGQRLPQPGVDEPVVILGGSMNVDQGDRHPWIDEERLWVADLIASPQARVLGICLGAQLIAAALGDHVRDSPLPERGWLPITRSPGAEEHSLGALFPPEFTAFQAHGQCFRLPAGAVRLAHNDAWETQAFAVGERVAGVQFHPEFTPEIVSRIAAKPTSWRGPHVQQPDDWLEQAGRFAEQAQVLFGLLDGIALS